jgi:spore germination cell wall hydrolase CwlJ-like protein
MNKTISTRKTHSGAFVPLMCTLTLGSLWATYFVLEANDMTGYIRKLQDYEHMHSKLQSTETLNKQLLSNQVDPNQVQLPIDVAESIVHPFPASYSPLDVAATIVAMKHEAGNQGTSGMQAVAAVILNRVKAAHARTAVDAIIAPGQFEFVHSVPILKGQSQEAILALSARKEYEPARIALRDMIRVNRYIDRTFGAQYFANLSLVKKRAYAGDVASKNALRFFARLRPTRTIGQHTFFAG